MATLRERTIHEDGSVTYQLVNSISTSSKPLQNDEAFNLSSLKALSAFDIWNLDGLKERDQLYTNLLSSYKIYTESTLLENPKRQECFFHVALSILIISPIQFLVCLWFCLSHLESIEIIAPLMASGVEMFGALMFLPKIIAEYLFNTNETTSINNIVSAIQNYDISVRSGIRHTAESDHSTATKA